MSGLDDIVAFITAIGPDVPVRQRHRRRVAGIAHEDTQRAGAVEPVDVALGVAGHDAAEQRIEFLVVALSGRSRRGVELLNVGPEAFDLRRNQLRSRRLNLLAVLYLAAT